MKNVTADRKLDMREWNIGSPLKKAILDELGAIVLEALGSDHVYMYFPAIYFPDDGLDGKAPKDPTTLYLRTDLDDGTEQLSFSFSIAKAVDEMLWPGGKDELIPDGYFPDIGSVRHIANGLRSQAEKIESAISHLKETTMEAKNPLEHDHELKPPSYKTSEGEHLVGKSFNPGGMMQVTEVKRMAAELIDYIRANGKDPRCTQIAITEIEAGAMWGVKSVTKQPRE